MEHKGKVFEAETLELILQKLEWVCENNKNKIPYTLDQTGTYNNMDDPSRRGLAHEPGVCWWTNGFFGGILWQLYQLTREEKYCHYAREQEKKLDACFTIFDKLDHDVGFLWLLTAVADYGLTEDDTARRRGLHAATILAGRFNCKGNFIRAWNGEFNIGWAIIDCLMNLSILYWASRETKDPRFETIAMAHTDMVIRNFVREDGSVRHIVEFDPASGEYIRSHGGQGYEEGSCWSRGQAWALYGFINGYKNTQREDYLLLAKKTADYFLDHVPESNLVPVDFHQPSDVTWEDSSAACIGASGMLELAKHLSKEEGKKYYEGAVGLLNALCEHRICYDYKIEALVTNCSVAYHDDKKVNTLIYADYFFLEGLLKLKEKSFDMW